MKSLKLYPILNLISFDFSYVTDPVKLGPGLLSFPIFSWKLVSMPNKILSK